jgi:hypothetical protein
MPQIAAAWIGCPAVVIAQVRSVRHAKGTDRRDGTALGAAQLVDAVSSVENLALLAARET